MTVFFLLWTFMDSARWLTADVLTISRIQMQITQIPVFEFIYSPSRTNAVSYERRNGVNLWQSGNGLPASIMERP